MNHACSFIPAPRRIARACARRRLQWVAINAIAIVLGVCAALLTRSVLLSDASVSAPAIEAARGRLDSIVAEQNALAGELKIVESRLMAHAEATQHPDWSILLAYISRVAGDAIALDGFALEPADAPGVFSVGVRGQAASQHAVTTFVLALERSGVFSSTNLVRSGRTQSQTYTFAVACQIGEAPPPPAEPTEGAKE